MSLAFFGLGLLLCQGAKAQDLPPGAEETPFEPALASDTVVILEMGLLGEASLEYEIARVWSGPPAAEPVFVEVGETTLGVAVGVLDRDQRVIEVHLFRAAGEPLAELLVEPGVPGFADLDETRSVEVGVVDVRKATSPAADG